MNKIKIRDKIKKIINDENISGYDIQKKVGYSKGNITDLRKGRRSINNLTLSTIEKLEEYYNKYYVHKKD